MEKNPIYRWEAWQGKFLSHRQLLIESWRNAGSAQKECMEDSNSGIIRIVKSISRA